jgi:hypothetical protein
MMNEPNLNSDAVNEYTGPRIMQQPTTGTYNIKNELLGLMYDYRQLCNIYLRSKASTVAIFFAGIFLLGLLFAWTAGTLLLCFGLYLQDELGFKAYVSAALVSLVSATLLTCGVVYGRYVLRRQRNKSSDLYYSHAISK